jgi:hypothetical protein
LIQISVQLLTPSFEQIVIYFYLALILGADDVRGSNGRESLPFTRKVVILYFGNNTRKVTMPLILFVFVAGTDNTCLVGLHVFVEFSLKSA